MKKFIIIAASVILAGAAFCTAVRVYYKGYPERYIAEKYPDAEILGSSSVGDAVFNPNKLIYQCYDSEHNMTFTQEFLKKSILGIVVPLTETYRGYDYMLGCQQAFEYCRSKLESDYGGEFMLFPNPDEVSGVQVLLPSSAANDMSRVEKILDSAVKEVRDKAYIAYSLYVCSDDIYSRAVQADTGGKKDRPGAMNGDTFQLGPEFIEQLLDITLEEATAGDYDVSYIKGEPNSSGEKKISYYKQ